MALSGYSGGAVPAGLEASLQPWDYPAGWEDALRLRGTVPWQVEQAACISEFPQQTEKVACVPDLPSVAEREIAAPEPPPVVESETTTLELPPVE